MKNIFAFFFPAFIIGAAYGQTAFTELLEKKYSALPVKVRIESSGVYSISSFDIKNDEIWINSFDDPLSYCINKNIMHKQASRSSVVKDFISSAPDTQLKLISRYVSAFKDGNIKFIKSFLSGSEDIFIDNGGALYNLDEDKIRVLVKNRNYLQIIFELKNFNKEFKLSFPSNLAYADLIGIDSAGNSFIIVENYISDIPLKIQREVYTISPSGSVLSILEVPSVKYLYTVRDFEIDASGNLYQLISDKDKISVVKWSGLSRYTASRIKYPEKYNSGLNYIEDTPLNESVQNEYSPGSVQSSSRTTALRMAESYVLFKYSCSLENLSPTDVRGPDGDLVRTPSWLIVGMNARVPYMWGGFSTLAQFTSGLNSGKYAGDINTAGVSNYAVGVDCSGFVSRCWQLSYHSSTSNMPSITTQYSSWDDLKPGDAIHKVGHVRLFIDKAPNGALRVAEASSRDWAVSYWTYTPSDLTAYTPRYYNGMVNDYSFNQPALLSVLNESGGKVKIAWQCDTANVKGYRLYKSTDGISWSMILDESSLKSTSAEVLPGGNAEYYRVSSVSNNPPSFSESGWSNALGAGQFTGTKNILIVDGFERQSGGWRGSENTFACRYGRGLEAVKLNFETVKNSCLKDSSFNMSKYDAVFWILGDESTANETFDSTEQKVAAKYLESGGSIFVSGSEAGWDLSNRGSSADKNFYNKYLKAEFVSDTAASNSVAGVEGSALDGVKLNFGQTYLIKYPDEINAYGGSSLCLKYSNNKGAGIQYSGEFGYSSVTGRIIYLGFPLETTADDSSFNYVIAKAVNYFFYNVSSVSGNKNVPVQFALLQNYPNPFNPVTTIDYSVPSGAGFSLNALKRVTLKVYNLLGQAVVTLVDKIQAPGNYKIQFNGSKLPSGIYFYRLNVRDSNGNSDGSITGTKKLILLK